MKIERATINGKSYYFVDGTKINSEALTVIMRGLFGKDVSAKIYRDVIHGNGAVIERYLGDGNDSLIAQLEEANKKIAALEQAIAKLVIENIYLAA